MPEILFFLKMPLDKSKDPLLISAFKNLEHDFLCYSLFKFVFVAQINIELNKRISLMQMTMIRLILNICVNQVTTNANLSPLI